MAGTRFEFRPPVYGDTLGPYIRNNAFTLQNRVSDAIRADGERIFGSAECMGGLLSVLVCFSALREKRVAIIIPWTVDDGSIESRSAFSGERCLEMRASGNQGKTHTESKACFFGIHL